MTLTVISVVFIGAAQGYTNTTNACIACHNGIDAPYALPHNDTVMCENCHLANPHKMRFIQPDGSYGARATAASCPECHQAGIPPEVNANFTSAYKIPTTLHHGSSVSNGSKWGNYWDSASIKTACIYCHNKTLHNVKPLGRLLEWLPDYQMKAPIGNEFSCSSCHYRGAPSWSIMNSSFASAGLPTPPEITNGTNWNGTFTDYYNHTIISYNDQYCTYCHGSLIGGGANMSEFMHTAATGQGGCKLCHSQVTNADLGQHSLFNGSSDADDGDCQTCHYGSIPMVPGGVNNANTYYCADCHTAAGTAPNKSSKIFTEKMHGEAGCMDCHVADGTFHQDNPRGSVANATYISRYAPGNTTVTDCADCHYKSNLDDAPFNAPAGGSHIQSQGGACAGGCHGSASTMVQKVHSLNVLDWGVKPVITVPSVSPSSVQQGTDAAVTATVTLTGMYGYVDGAQYRIMSGTTEIVPWTPMSAVDGDFNGTSEAAAATFNTTMLSADTYSVEVRGMAGGPAQNPAIRYYPMNGDVSTSQSTTFTVFVPPGYINGTVTDGVSSLMGVNVFANDPDNTNYTTGLDGSYSLRIPPGTYNVTASRQPEYYDNTTADLVVTSDNTTVQDFVLTLKPTGNISGAITGVT